MKLRFSPASPFVRKVTVVALETGLDARVERVPASVAPTKPNPDIQKDNPLAKVPALVLDNGETLYDSPVICEYLDSLHGGAKMFPAAGAARWTALRRQALGDGILDAAVLTRYESIRPDPYKWQEWMDGQMAKVQGALAAFEAEAGALGATLDIGTITLGCALGYLDFRFADLGWRKSFPKLAAWYEGFAARPSMKATVPQG
ncbi:MAG TPA: glutathione S-transferase [Candidatus Sulfotelmatobacter sp.]|nr:glutathione S-transferase [Candidatus Sulfotelmatobacter sp.]